MQHHAQPKSLSVYLYSCFSMHAHFVCVCVCGCMCVHMCICVCEREQEKEKMCVLLRIPLTSSSEPPSLMWADGQFRVGSGPLTTP